MGLVKYRIDHVTAEDIASADAVLPEAQPRDKTVSIFWAHILCWGVVYLTYPTTAHVHTCNYREVAGGYVTKEVKNCRID